MCARIQAAIGFFLALSLSSCGIVPAVPSPSATPTATRVPTLTPSPTITPTFTPVPEPDAKAMIAWQELGFSRDVLAAPPAMVGLKEGREILTLQRPDGSKLTLRIAGSFFFYSKAEPGGEVVAGYSFLLPAAADAAIFDHYARNQARDFASATLHPEEPPTRVADIDLPEDIGDASGAATIEYKAADGSPSEHRTVVFRTGGIGAVVFVNRPLGLERPVSVEDLARVYESSIRNPPAGCRITSVAALEDSPIPGFRFEAEGFYPWEGRTAQLAYDLGGQTIVSQNPGMGGESVDRRGQTTETLYPMVVTIAEGQLIASEPQEYTLTIIGSASGCKAEATAFWPGAAAAPIGTGAPPAGPATRTAPKPALTYFPAATPNPNDMQTPAMAQAATIIAQASTAAALTGTAIAAATLGSTLPRTTPTATARTPVPTVTGTLRSSGNLALRQSVTVSRSEFGRPAAHAVDANASTYWGSGDFAPQWIKIDLGAPARVTGFRLLVFQLPDGYTEHQIDVWNSAGEMMEVHRFREVTRDQQWLTFQPETPLEDVRFVRVRTMVSPSWVSWGEVQVLGER